MPYTHHTHSGQFCAHAADTLASIVHAAAQRGFRTLCLTEHIRRGDLDLYPEEVSAGMNAGTLATQERGFLAEAVRLREEYKGKAKANAGDGATGSTGSAGGASGGIQILIGLETEWIRHPESERFCRNAMDEAATTISSVLKHFSPGDTSPSSIPHLGGGGGASLDLLVGSVHHVLGHPIDLDAVSYARARAAAGGSDEALFTAYYDAQADMLRTLRPPVVAHFDLVRLLSEEPNACVQERFSGGKGEEGEGAGGGGGGDGATTDGRDGGDGSVWRRILRNIDMVVQYGGLFELNSAALRKGLHEPYPQAAIARAVLQAGGRFVMSDDAHSVAQLGVCYPQLLAWMQRVGIGEVWFLERKEEEGKGQEEEEEERLGDERFPRTVVKRVEMASLREDAFFGGWEN